MDGVRVMEGAGCGVGEMLEAIVDRILHPDGLADTSAKAIF